MPQPGTALEKLGFLTIGLFDGRDPGPGHQVTLRMIELGERLGFDSAWLRHRHLQYGISSPVAIMAAASQRTTRICASSARRVASSIARSIKPRARPTSS